METEVGILGYKAKIESISSQLKDGLHWKEDQLVVWLCFEKAVGNVVSFAVLLPVKKYDREEFLYNIRRRGEEEIKRILEKYEKDKREMAERDERKKALDAMVAEAQSLIE